MDSVSHKKATDIRAPRQLELQQILSWRWQRSLVLLLSDTAALAIAWQIAVRLNRYYSPLPPQLSWGVWLGLPLLFWLFAVVTLILFARSGLYGSSTQWKNYIRSGQMVSVVYLSSLVISYFYDPKLDLPRSLFFTAWFGSVALVIGFRLITSLVLRRFEQTQTPVFILAPAERLSQLSRVLKRRSRCKLVGAALAATASSTTTIQAILASGAQEVLAEGLPQSELASGLYWQLRRAGVTLRLIPSSLEMLHRRGVPEVFAGVPTLRMEADFLSGWDYRFKRVIDLVGALVGLVVLSPLFLGVAIAIKLTSKGPILFCQERMGLHGRVFQMWKFRTMVPEAASLQAALEQQNETGDGVMFKIKNDPRITRIGHFLRRTSIDELPQLINVLLGQMSLVGPRPLPLRDIQRFDPWHHTRHQVLPGITGLWQISGRSEIDAFNEAARLDLYYIDNWSLNLDLEILLETVKIVLFGRGAY
ncbi:sugar transferase [Leptothermofonsia sichuanensis E412]|uniref:sugar transferase n=1 Tax=Leptothermofonsia sichuanensis TaxID=2917832 RepID=UPI001CA7737B|nr:sugar transferase [Leptothermofonsia sichuanensis]QZZ20298.1 sugar transferase [Leptothermofonsia sichuanensis E412]